MVTIVFTDLVNSTLLKSKMPGENITARNYSYWELILKPHRERMESELRGLRGRVVKTEGDAYIVAFASVLEAVNWAVAVQTSHTVDPIITPLGSLRVKIGLHVGEPLIDPDDSDDYVGREVDYAARIASLATGGQIVVSEAVASLVKSTEISGLLLYPHGKRDLKGIGQVVVFELLHNGKQPQNLLIGSSTPTNIPVSFRDFLGRSELVAEILRQVQKGGTIILRGEGGIGKSAVALEIAKTACASGAFDSGVVWVNCELSPTQDECVREIARVICGQRYEGQGIEVCNHNISEHLKTGRALLIFDSFEMIAENLALSIWIMQVHAPHCVLITTQKLPTHVHGDVVPVPDLRPEEASELFSRRANQAGVGPGGQEDLVRRLCEAVGYLPLAIELLAARAARIPLSRLLERVRRDLAVLDADQDPTRPSRHQSVRACFGIAYEPLSAGARELLAYLSTLLDGAKADLISAFSASEGWDEYAEELVSASVCRLVGERYRMHSLIRQFALEKSGERLNVIRLEVAAAVSKIAKERSEQTRPGSAPPSVTLEALNWIESEWRNLLGCADAAISARDSATIVNIERSLEGFYLMRGRWGDCEEFYRGALAVKRYIGDERGEAETLMQLGRLYERQGGWRRALVHYTASLEKHRRIGDRFGEARILNNMGVVYRHQRRWSEAESV